MCNCVDEFACPTRGNALCGEDSQGYSRGVRPLFQKANSLRYQSTNLSRRNGTCFEVDLWVCPQELQWQLYQADR